MDFIFSAYPDHPWFADWTLEPRHCSSSFRRNSPGQLFRTMETVGRIVPNTEQPEWALQVPVPQNSRINMLFNGFCAYLEKKGRYGAEILCPEPGVLLGRTTGIPSPQLATDLALEEGDGFQWLEDDHASAFLLIKDGAFCLITKTHAIEEAQHLAEGFLAKDLDVMFSTERQRRKGAEQLFEEMAHHDSLAAIAAESMMKALRPAEGSIPSAWSQSSSTEHPLMDINEIHPLALAWRLLDIYTAEEILLCALRIQSNAGAIPVRYSPHATHSVLEAPKPMLAKTIETVWEVRKNQEFLEAVLPLLRRHIQWLLHHFDPKRRGLHCWKNRSEPLVAELFDSDLSTVDLAILLITEIDALNRLQRHMHNRDDAAKEHFEAERIVLENNILNQFWNEGDQAFSNGLLRDKMVTVHGFVQVVPLIWRGLPHMRKITLLERIVESGTLPGGLSMLSWRKSAMDDNSFPLLQQLLILQALQVSDPHGELLSDFSKITLQGFVEWHRLALEKEARLPINAVTAAYIMNVQAIRQYRYHGKGALTGRFFKFMRRVRADRFDLAVVAATLFAIVSIHLVYSVLHAPPPLPMLEAQMNSAYANKDGDATLENCIAIIKYYPANADLAKLFAANISMLQNQYAQAALFYEQVRAQYPDSPGPMIALGLAYQLQGQFKEAEGNYYEFCYIFDEIFPELVAEVNRYRYLMQEGFKSPPKWQEMYRYQLMHEL